MPVPTEMNNEIYLTSAEAAELLGYTREWFSKAIAPKYNLKRYQKGIRPHPVLYKKSEVEALLGIRPADDAQPPST